MSEKTPRQLLRESLERNAEEVASWPSWMRTAISTKGMFSVPSPDEVSGRGERIGASPGAQPQPEK